MITKNPENGISERFEVRIFLKTNKAWRFRRWLGKFIINKATWIGSALCGIQFTFIEKNDNT